MLQEKGNNYIKEISKIKNIEQLNIFKSNLESLNLDLNEYFIQREMKIKTVKDSPPEINPPSKNTQNELGNGLFLTTKEISNKMKKINGGYKFEFCQRKPCYIPLYYYIHCLNFY